MVEMKRCDWPVTIGYELTIIDTHDVFIYIFTHYKLERNFQIATPSN